MGILQSGFARCDITPAMGAYLAGYPYVREATGILDPLCATAVAFDDGNKRAILISVDNTGLNQDIVDPMREAVAAACEIEKEAVYIACTHTHQAPAAIWEGAEQPYTAFLTQKLCDTARLAVQDLAPTEMYYTNARVEDVAFVRRFRMKDGSTRTNPGCQNPDILECLGTPDETGSLVILKREGKPEIGIVHFQVHPDVIGGTMVSADYPKFVRDTYESLIDNSRCIYINGAQGDTNHIDVRLNRQKDMVGGYERSRYMGRKIAMSLIANYPIAKKLEGTAVHYGQRNLYVPYNRGTPEELEIAKVVLADYLESCGTYESYQACRNRHTMNVPRARRIVRLAEMEGDKELHVSAISVGEVVFAGLPGEPFADIGRGIKAQSKFTLTLPTCCTNGHEGYYPMMDAFQDGGYESNTTNYAMGTAEKLIETATALVNSL